MTDGVVSMEKIQAIVEAMKKAAAQTQEFFMLVHHSHFGMLKRWRNIDRGRDAFLRRRARRVVRGSR